MRLRYSMHMYTRRFFIISLSLPLAFLLFGVMIFVLITPEMPQHLGVVLVPYVSFYLFFLMWVSRHAPRAIRYAAYRAPLIFLAFEISYLVLEFTLGASIAKDAIGLGGVIVTISTYTVLLGYLYVFLMEQGYISYLYYLRHHHMTDSKSTQKSRVRFR